MIPFNIYIQLWVKSIFVYAWKYCTNLYSELLEIMDTQWGISKSVTSANSIIWTTQWLMAVAISRTALNYSCNKWPVTPALTRSQRDHPPEQQPPRQSRRGRVCPKGLEAFSQKSFGGLGSVPQNLQSHCYASPFRCCAEVQVMQSGNRDRYLLWN